MVEEWKHGIETILRQSKWEELWEKWARSRPEAVRAEVIAQFREEFKGLVTVHIDNHLEEGMAV